MKNNWKILKTKETYQDKIVKIEHRKAEFTKIGRSMPFTIINTKDWVIILPKSVGNYFTMVRQYRVATDEVTLEFPGGAINKGEDLDLAAKRELKEETGLIADKLTFLGKISPNPALLSNSCFVYLAEDCKDTGETDFDMFEDIEIERFKETEIDKMMIEGQITHSLVLAAYNLYKLKNV